MYNNKFKKFIRLSFIFIGLVALLDYNRDINSEILKKINNRRDYWYLWTGGGISTTC